MKILVLSASTGNGHISAANAIDAVCREMGLDVSTVDALKVAPKAFQLWYGGGYEMVVRRSPAAWGRLYKVSDDPNISYKVQTRMDTLFMKGLQKLIAKEKPDWVVCTHSLPQPKLAQLREIHDFKMAIVVTDLYPHLMWLRGEPDWYFVPSEWTQELLEKREPASKGKITITGIPIHPHFGRESSADEVNKHLGRDPNVPMVTMTSGGIGGGPFGAALSAMLKVDRPMHLEVICGRNEARRKDIEKRALKVPYNSPVKVVVRGHISQQEMAWRMQHSAFLITKPGGLTTSECLACGCPMLVYHPFLIPGQEEGNAEFLVSEGAGVQAHTPDELISTVRNLLDHPEKLSTMSGIARGFGKPLAANDIVKKLVELG
jgi:processive 1,2-diacylglycerol beta-glucosyltransferase